MSFHTTHQEYLTDRINRMRKVGVNTLAYQRLEREAMEEAERYRARLSLIIDRLPERERKIIMLVMLQETRSLFFKLMAEGAFMLHQPAMEEAAAAHDHEAFDTVRRSLKEMVDI